MKKVSVALCTYNGAEFLTEQLESIGAQTRLPDELIVNDDCSSDETPRILAQFAARAAFPVLIEINQKNLGSTKNFERAIARCSGDLIFLSDQDDVWMPEKIEKTAAKFSESDSIKMVFSNAELVGENLEPLNRHLWEFTFTEEERKTARRGMFLEVLLHHDVVTGATMAFRADCRELFMPIPADLPNIIHDGWIALVLALEGEVAHLDERLVRYRQHPRQQLGVGLSSLVTEKSGAKRTIYYEKSIKHHTRETERMEQISDFFLTLPHFRNSRLDLPALVENTIKPQIARTREILRHYEARKALPANRLRRLAPLAREVLTGRYHRYSSGFLSIVKDALEKW